MKHAQVSSEYLIIVGFVVGLTIPLLVVYFTFANDINDQITSSQIDQVTRAIVDASDTVYFLGEPSQTTLKVYIPPNVRGWSLGNKALLYKIRTSSGISDIVYVSSANLTGTLPNSSGTYRITVKATQNGVDISYR